MRILFVASFSGIGGAERSLMPLARRLNEQGHRSTLFLARPPRDDTVFKEFSGQVDIPAGSGGRSAKSLGRLLRLSGMIRQSDLVVATSELTPTYIATVLATLWRKPIAADVQVHLSSWIRDNCHPLHRRISRWIYRRIPAIRCVSEGVAADLREQFGVAREQITVIPVPFDLASIRSASEQPLPASDPAIFRRPVIIGAGRLTSQKRFDVAIRALDILRLRDKVDANLLILGEGEDRGALEEQAAAAGLADRVFLPGQTDNLWAYLRRASAFLLSSDYEGLPRVLIEALAVGCPAVATDCPSGPLEILVGGNAGLLAPCGDAECLASGLARILTDRDIAQKLAGTGKIRVEAFDTPIVVGTLCTWLEKAAVR